MNGCLNMFCKTLILMILISVEKTAHFELQTHFFVAEASIRHNLAFVIQVFAASLAAQKLAQ